jgi:hypothetical protein
VKVVVFLRERKLGAGQADIVVHIKTPESEVLHI